ncbi:DNA-directed RNA polymerase III subunit C1 (rpo31), partial [Spiromyces aspiralis]
MIAEVYMPHEAFLSVGLSIETIEKLQLELTLDQICSAIANAPKLKIGEVNVRIDDDRHIRVYIPSKDETELHYNMQRIKRALPGIVVKGIPSISRALISISEDKADDRGDHVLSAEGYGLREVMNTEGIVGTQTWTNHIMEAAEVLGIEAARTGIIKEIFEIMDRYDILCDSRHLMLLADLMTAKGEVLGITRFGISKMKDSVMMLASFEMTTDHLFNAAVYGRKDAILGVSECIIMGVPMPIGTGLFRLLKQDNKACPAKMRP